MAEDIKKILEDMQERLKKVPNDDVKLFFIIRTRRRRTKEENENKEKEGQSEREINGSQLTGKMNGGQPRSEGNEDQPTDQQDQPTEEVIEYLIEYEVLNTKLTPNVRAIFIDIAKEKIKELLEVEDLRIEGYDPTVAWNQPTVEFLEMSEVEQLDKIQNDMGLANLKSYILERKEIPWAYAVKMSDDGLIIFRRFSAGKILERKGLIPLFEKDGVFNKLEEPAITIDKEIDCIYDIKGKKVYILNKKEFEEIFSFMEMFVQAIRAKKPILVETNLIDNVDLLVDKCRTDPRKTRKLYGIMESPALNQLDTQKVARIDKQYILGLSFTPTGQIVVKAKDMWKVLRVLADDYLISSATILRYEVQSKIGHLPRMNIYSVTNSKKRTVTIEGNVINADKVVINWGDGNEEERTSLPLVPNEHTYEPGTHTIIVTAHRHDRSISRTLEVEVP